MRLLLSILPLLFLMACDDSATADATANSASVATTNSQPSGPDNCLGGEGVSLCDFLSRDIIAKYIPGDFEIKGYQETKRKMLSSCGVSVDHPTKTRKLVLPAMTMDVPLNYMVALSQVNTSDNQAARFDGMYRTMTPEEAAAAKVRIKAELDARVAKGEVDQSTADAAGGLASLGTKAQYFPLEGIGDKAVYGGVRVKAASETVETIYVLVGNTSFALEVDMTESREHSLEAAKEIAKGIIANCK